MPHTPQWVLDKIQKIQVQKLTELDLTADWSNKNKLQEIPSEVFELEFLTSLKVSRHEITQIPETIAKLKNLQALYLDDNQISEISGAICQLKKLNILSLRDNQISQIPQAIAQLQNLQTLDLESNDISEIPQAIAQLKKLEKIDLGWNKLKKIPQEIALLPNLKTLNLYNNHLEVPPPDIVNQGLEAIRAYYEYETFKASGLDYLSEAKVLIVGETGAGKTTLSNIILAEEEGFQLEETNHGIDIHEWHFFDQDRNFRVNIWDFSGQDIYYDIHHFFLTQKSLYIIVINELKENTELNYWLNMIQLAAKKSPVIILINEKFVHKHKIDESDLQAHSVNIREIITCDLSKPDEIPALIAKIKHYIQTLEHIGDRLPKTWINLRNSLDTDGRNSLSLKDYHQLCDEFGIRKTKDKLALSQHLHDLGVILHLRENPMLQDTVILHPLWATNAIYHIFDHPEIIANYGTFSRQDLSLMSINTAFDLMQDEVLQLILKFQLCYRLTPTANNYISPQLLETSQPRYKWDKKQNIVVYYRYPFMPKGIISRLIVVLHQFIKNQRLIWRYGVILSREQTDAEIIENYRDREISIQVRGEQKQEFMALICREIEQIHASYHHLKFQKFIPCNCEQCKSNINPYFYEQSDLVRYLKAQRSTIECHKNFADISVNGLLDYVGVDPVSLLEKDSLRNSNKLQDYKVKIAHSPTKKSQFEIVESAQKRSPRLSTAATFVCLFLIILGMALTVAKILSLAQFTIAIVVLMLLYLVADIIILRSVTAASSESTVRLSMLRRIINRLFKRGKTG